MWSAIIALLLVQATLLLGAPSLQRLAADIVSDDAADNNEMELIDQIILNSDDLETLINKLSELRGQWPYKDKSTCNKTSTRDHGFYHYKLRGDSDTKVGRLLRSTPTCGVASVTTDERLPTDNNAKDESGGTGADVDDGREEQIDRRLSDEQLAGIGLVDGDVEQTPAEEPNRNQYHKTKEHTPRVVGGRITRPGAWPWLAAIGRKTSGPKCGGSVIADRWVVTAAHCFQDSEMPCIYNVRVGSRSWFYDNEGTHIDATVEAIYRHPDYDKETHANDVALLKLSVALDLNKTSHINAICLPDGSQSVKPGTVCMAAGWGRTGEAVKASVYESREVEIPVITYKDKCGAYPRGTIRRGMLCAGHLKGGKDTCQGDSGGPLVYHQDGRWTLLGLTSFGEGCARSNYPGIYTDVGYHLRWIASVLDRF